MMKILYVITGLGQGGAERVVCDLADQMRACGHKVKIAYLVGDVVTQPKHKDIELIHLGLTNALSLPKVYIKLSKLINSYQPDVVHAHMVHANILARLIRVITPMSKLITTAHSSNEGGNLRMLAYRVTHRLADLTTNVSNTAVTNFEKKKAVPKNGMQTIYNGINFSNFSYIKESKDAITKELNLSINTKIILAVGRLSTPKNYPNLLKAIYELKKTTTYPFKVIIAGDGSLRSDIEHLIVALGLQNEIILLGSRQDIPQLMSACDVYVLSSDYEGLPTVLIEALACQANVVATDVSGAREIISDFGTIVPTNDASLLAEAIKKSLINHDKNTLGYNYVKAQFDLNVIADKWFSIYHEY